VIAAMAKIVVTSLKSKAERPRSAASVTKKRVKDTDGHLKTLRTLDTGSHTFGADFGYVFGENVAKARRENKRTIGATDVAVAKR
jgi:hypothetical protein